MSLAPNAPTLDGWITIAEAAETLGVTKQAVHAMIRTGEVKSLHRIGKRPAARSKPVYVVADTEIDELRDRRAARQVSVESISEAVASA
jgi:excisionase family DNA binding protein